MVEQKPWIEPCRGAFITPNPVTAGRTEVEVRYCLAKTGKAGPVRVMVFDVTGREILSQAYSVKHGVSSVSVSLDLRSGVYLMRINTGECTATQKFIVHNKH